MWLSNDSKKKINDFKNAPDEKVLFEAIKQPDLFQILVERYTAAFLRKAKTILHSNEDAEDMVQETFVKIYMHANKFQIIEGASFKSWGYKILINNCLTHSAKMKKNRDRFVNIDPEFEELLPDGNNSFEKYTTKEYILSIFSRMPDTFSEVLDKYYLQGVSQKELAQVEGVTVSAVKTRIHRAKKEFKNIQSELMK